MSILLTSEPTSLLTCSMSLLDQVSSLTASYSAATRWQVSVLGFSRGRPCSSSRYSVLPSSGLLLLSKRPRLVVQARRAIKAPSLETRASGCPSMTRTSTWPRRLIEVSPLSPMMQATQDCGVGGARHVNIAAN